MPRHIILQGRDASRTFLPHRAQPFIPFYSSPIAQSELLKTELLKSERSDQIMRQGSFNLGHELETIIQQVFVLGAIQKLSSSDQASHASILWQSEVSESLSSSLFLFSRPAIRLTADSSTLKASTTDSISSYFAFKLSYFSCQSSPRLH